ncbi:BA14K family protein [Mesorhizobium sp. NBSH29]|uniref:BA14K family protein n=1 Tax=Mesorhizobium sp. NBSH29 TaxID=2654249 RepID=UPI00189677E5|nr:BA14K family protein [Mesorhizobium sp. NBSH29]QPC87708.1 BA14K family protein [Mesorhizobium sp. NBSH29]
MKKFMSGLCAAALGFSFAITAAVPANSAPISVPRAEAASEGNVVLAQSDRRWRRHNRRAERRHMRRDIRRADRGGYYRGHRGYRNHRPGYRRHNGFWFPAAAFIAGAAISGAINQPRVRGGNAHVQWCYNKYRSYRASDNTYQPYNGGRQPCYSPY